MKTNGKNKNYGGHGESPLIFSILDLSADDDADHAVSVRYFEEWTDNEGTSEEEEMDSKSLKLDPKCYQLWFS